MRVKSIVELNVIDKISKEYDFPIKDENGNETGRNKGISHYLEVKEQGSLAQHIKMPKDLEGMFDEIPMGINKFVFEFETEPKAFVGKDGKAKINFNDVPSIVDIVPFKAK